MSVYLGHIAGADEVQGVGSRPDGALLCTPTTTAPTTPTTTTPTTPYTPTTTTPTTPTALLYQVGSYRDLLGRGPQQSLPDERSAEQRPTR
jgi:hypothetical protein